MFVLVGFVFAHLYAIFTGYSDVMRSVLLTWDCDDPAIIANLTTTHNLPAHNVGIKSLAGKWDTQIQKMRSNKNLACPAWVVITTSQTTPTSTKTSSTFDQCVTQRLQGSHHFSKVVHFTRKDLFPYLDSFSSAPNRIHKNKQFLSSSHLEDRYSFFSIESNFYLKGILFRQEILQGNNLRTLKVNPHQLS